MAIDLGNPGDRRPDVVTALMGYIGPLVMVDVAGPVTYAPADHLNRGLRLAAGLGEVAVTVPADTPVGHSFLISSPTGSWPRILMPGGVIEHPDDHTRGAPKSTLSVVVVAVGIVQIAGVTST